MSHTRHKKRRRREKKKKRQTRSQKRKEKFSISERGASTTTPPLEKIKTGFLSQTERSLSTLREQTKKNTKYVQ